MQILLTNDDGIHAPGLAALRDELQRLGSVKVVAPQSEQSGVGLSITYLHPLMVKKEIRNGQQWGWAVAGSPADCVKLGMLQFCETKPDLVVSGINSGMNVGINVLYSGTVAAAIEGAFFGVTSVAVSTAIDSAPDFAKSAKTAVTLIEQILDHDVEPGSLWNVNIPENRPEWPLGVKTVSLGVRRHIDVIEKRLDPRGRPYYWSGIDPLETHRLEQGTDVRELADGFVTMTPLDFDVTHFPQVKQFAETAWRLEK